MTATTYGPITTVLADPQNILHILFNGEPVLPYPHWTSGHYEGMKMFWASIKKIDDVMRHFPLHWGLSEAARNDGTADFKPYKLSYWKNVIQDGGQITPTELITLGDYRFDIMDGRHRIYALHDAGFTDVLVQVDPLEAGDPLEIETIAELLAP